MFEDSDPETECAQQLDEINSQNLRCHPPPRPWNQGAITAFADLDSKRGGCCVPMKIPVARNKYAGTKDADETIFICTRLREINKTAVRLCETRNDE